MKIRVTEDDLWEDTNGGCISCGEIQYGGVEPDAEGYPCEYCGKNTVYGLGHLAVTGKLEIDQEEQTNENQSDA